MSHSIRTLLPIMVAFTALATPAAAIPVSGDPVLYWNEVMLGSAPWNPGQQRPAAILNIALHDAVNATQGRPDYYYLKHVATAGGDTRAAASVAARDVLTAMYPARSAEFDAKLAASLALVPDSAAKTAGIATGAKVAMLALANRATDGSSTPKAYTPSGLPGHWAPTPPGFGPPVTPELANVTPWLMASGDQFRAAPPPDISSAAYAAYYNEVKTIGSAGSLVRSLDQTKAAVFWAGAMGPGPWMRAALDLASAKGLSTIENARVFGLLTSSVADAVITAWDTKYNYDYWRPVTGIRAGDTDGNAATLADPTWNPLIFTPPHPSYMSAHATIGGAASTVLGNLLGDANSFCLTSLGNTRCWDSFSLAAQDSADSRLWGGIHWRFDNEAGLASGRAVGQYALGTGAFGAVPEPSNWALMIAGFGLTGALARRRRAATATAG